MWRTSEIIGYGIRATDGSIGRVVDLLLDDEAWTVRWAVVDTGTWLPGRKVLLPVVALGEPDPIEREVPVDLSRDQVKESPSPDVDAAVSRRMEAELFSYYRLAPYWYPGFAPAVGGSAGPVPATRGTRPDSADARGDIGHGGADLRSVREVTGYRVGATDGDIGHVEDLLVEKEGWAIRYLIVDTRNWWPGRKVIVSPRWASGVGWSRRQVFIDLEREQIENSPDYEPAAPVDRAYEERLHRHYDFRPYWIKPHL